MAAELLGQEVWQMRFDEIAFDEEFDGIWACASLLHVPEEDLPGVLGKLHKALKKNGKLYVSFKYGEGMTKRGERMFCDFTEKSLPKVLTDAGFSVLEIGITSDITNIYEEGELDKESTVRKFRTVQIEGGREVIRNIVHTGSYR